MDSLGQIARNVFKRRITRKNYVFSLVIFATGLTLLSFLSPYLDKNLFRAYAHSDIAAFLSVFIYLLCIMLWSLFWIGLTLWFVARTAFRLNDVGTPGWPLALALYALSVVNNYHPGPVERWLIVISLIGVLCALVLPSAPRAGKPEPAG
ncbi:protein of unknown function DUF805 [Serratia sp. AS12]|uniref:DUF805 domain-containing protein n=1 Tax=Serratia TaxID=613 RepID=UPI00020E9D05|nr:MULTISPECIES: DUF805 domain-containing protein [Serratia]AEF46698.1 protein of unknown function DUF805 [Serratia plymuthica AS9]AEF51650.1 protein of unknown function DUF805 [Serratia sp. AS12]AEG29357.1 protein of unknown function DUF805 [Serratia sp. AS13]UTN95400.1 DUF805 domain-containing protein [Serratia plymuthica]